MLGLIYILFGDSLLEFSELPQFVPGELSERFGISEQTPKFGLGSEVGCQYKKSGAKEQRNGDSDVTVDELRLAEHGLLLWHTELRMRSSYPSRRPPADDTAMQ